MKKTFFRVLGLSLLCGTFFAEANTSGVHGPNVKAGERSMQLRFAYTPGDNSGDEDYWASRLHYQYAFNDRLRGRVILQGRDRGDFQYDYFRGELLYNFKKATDSDNWSSGVRFDIRTRRGDRAEEFAINWTNQWDLDNGYRLRAILIANRQFNSAGADPGIGIATRASLSTRLENGLRVGIEMFNEYGKLGDFADFDDQTHHIGPMLGGKVGGFKYEVRYLAGVTDAGRDNHFGLRFDKSF